MGNLTYNSDYDVRLATLGEMGGDITKRYDSVYTIDLEILKIIQEGGIGGASIDDEHVSTTTTYSSSKIMTLLADAGFNVEVVQELPATGDAHTIYFVPKTGSTGDVYNEYLYVDNAWELIGSTEVDLSNYYNKTEVDGLLSGKQNVLTAGDNISIDSNGVISANIEVATVEEVEDLFAPKAVKFTANAASTVGLEKLSTNQTLEYSVDEGATWNNMDTSTSVSLAQGDKMYVRGQLSGNNSNSNYTQFKMTGSIAASGNMNYIWNKNNPKSTTLSYSICGYFMFKGCTSLTTAPELPATTLANYCYYNMFQGCTSLTTAPDLPATTLTDNCYSNMFNGCTSLTTAPELPATTLANDCYYNMFYGCTSLTTAPELPATTLLYACYQSMFRECKSLTTAPELPATTLAINCYNNMFYGCTSLTTAPELPATTLLHACYESMFRECKSLTTAPELPATKLESSCYNGMFQGCTSLKTAPELPATMLKDSCYRDMFKDCKSLTTAPELPATTLVNACYSEMFRNCTSLTSAPELPATKLESSCYIFMFDGCKSINYIKCLATDISARNCTIGWLGNVSSTGTFVKNSAMSSWTTGNNGIPSNWTVQDA